MLKKIVAIKNVGRFISSAHAGNPQLSRYTFITGANGYGKTTLCSVLRSLQTGDPSHILGRKTLGSTGVATVELLLDTRSARFDGTSWNAPHPTIAIFDGVFVADNVHSGEVVDLEHKRNLYRVIVGEEGVKLATEDATLAAASRAKTTEITIASKTLQGHVPAGMKLEAFLALPNAPDIDQQIIEQQQEVNAVSQASTIRSRAALVEFSLSMFPGNFMELLARTLDDVSEDAEQMLTEHLTRHSVEATSWIGAGIEHADDTCPFCGQDVVGLPLIAAYRAIFSARYKFLVSDVADMKRTISQDFSEAASARLETVAEQNRSNTEFWEKYCVFDSAFRDLPTSHISDRKALLTEAMALLDRKSAAPLEAVQVTPYFLVVEESYGISSQEITAANSAIRKANERIAHKKNAAGAADSKAAETELVRRRAIKTRHTPTVSALCAGYSILVTEKDTLEKQKEIVREKLDKHTKTVVKPYERRINAYLEDFNAGFGIAETKHSFPSGVAASSYRLVINRVAVDVGDSKTSVAQPSFKNTLSAGDRTTLALAFFLAHLENATTSSTRLVVFDDPFNSQDSFRRRQTVHEIMKVAGRSAQVLVLSHDATFLKQLWDKAPPAERVALVIADHRAQGSKIMPIDLEKACQGRTATDIDDLQAFLATGAGALLDIVRKKRVILETHCRTTYPNCFAAGDWLGDIVRKIREGGPTHPAHDLYDELDQINSYTSQYHHGENVLDGTPDQIDATELTGFTRKTLRLVNALQA